VTSVLFTPCLLPQNMLHYHHGNTLPSSPTFTRSPTSHQTSVTTVTNQSYRTNRKFQLLLTSLPPNQISQANSPRLIVGAGAVWMWGWAPCGRPCSQPDIPHAKVIVGAWEGLIGVDFLSGSPKAAFHRQSRQVSPRFGRQGKRKRLLQPPEQAHH
jgi:hypothetical protein